MCRSPSAWQPMFVIAENVFGPPVVQDRQSAPAPADVREIRQKDGLAGMAPKPAQLRLDGVLGRRCNVLACKPGELSCQLLGFRVLDTQRHPQVPWFLNRYIIPIKV